MKRTVSNIPLGKPSDMRISVIAFLLAMSCISLTGAPASAFNVTPISHDFDAEPGESYVGSIMVTGGQEPEAVSVYVSDWNRMPNGDRVDNEPGRLSRSCGKWLAVGPTKFTVSAEDAIEVKYSFTVPHDATGSYWTYVMIEGVPRALAPAKRTGNRPGVGITATMRFAVRIVVNLNQQRNVSGRINAVEVVPSPEKAGLPPSAPVARFLFENTGNAFINARYYLEVRSLEGATVYRSGVQEFYAFPESEYWVSLPIEQQIAAGKYLALFIVDYGGSTRIAGEARFSVDNAGMPSGRDGAK